MSKITIQQGDNLQLLRDIPDNSIDSVVTDAPYGLGKEPDPVKLIEAWIKYGYLEIKGKGFMGKAWDAFVPQPIFWKEVFRVLKPGGHILCFFGTRTYDWGTLALRIAGFEIRDMITWHYGSGFPKSLDISRAIDKHLGAERIITREQRADYDSGEKINYDYRTSEDRERRDMPATEAAAQFYGYGTALKPATEPICLARKPLIGSVAQNALTHGTGGLNINGCRIEIKSQEEGRFPANLILDPFTASLMDEQSGTLTSGGGRKGESGKRTYAKTGVSNSLSGARSNTDKKYWDEERQDWYTLCRTITDLGGASRFFYCAKASPFERSAGLGPNASNIHPTVKPISLMRWLIRLITPKGGTCLDTFGGSGTTACAAAFEDVDIIIMEMEKEYIPIIEGRTAYWRKVANREKYIQELKNSVQTLF
jgi:site-specific DNA-methyltransferase (adenine-specific)